MKLVNFYEVQDNKGQVEWGGSSPHEAIRWFRKTLDTSIFVSVWNEEDIEEPKLVTDKVDVTRLLLALIVEEREENITLKPKKDWMW